MEGMLQSAMQSVVSTMTEEDNFLKNANFQDDMAYWERESDMALYDIGGQLLDLGVNFYSEKNKVADIDSFDGRFMLRIKRSHIRPAECGYHQAGRWQRHISNPEISLRRGGDPDRRFQRIRSLCGRSGSSQ